jgi:hypothetical protein
MFWLYFIFACTFLAIQIGFRYYFTLFNEGEEYAIHDP